MAERDLKAEQYALGVYGKKYGKMPSSSEEWATLHSLAYPGGVPEGLKAANAESTAAAGLTTPSLTPTGAGTGTMPTTPVVPTTPAAPALGPNGTSATGMNDAKTALDEAQGRFSKLTGPNQAYQVLQDALKTKIGAADQKIGQGSLNQAAGVTGYGSLGSSLATRAKELRVDQTRLQNMATTLGAQYKDEYTAAMQEIEAAASMYEFEATRFDAAEAIVQQQLNSMEMLEKQVSLNEASQKRLMTWQASIDAAEAKAKAEAEAAEATTYTSDEIAKMEEATKLSGIVDLNSALDAYAAIVEEGGIGTNLKPGQRAKVESAYTNIVTALKAAEALGALDAGVVTMVEGLVPKATSDGLFADPWQKGRILDIVEQVKGNYATDAQSLYDRLVVRAGGSAADPYISSLADQLGIVNTVDASGSYNPFTIDVSGEQPNTFIASELAKETKADGTKLTEDEVDYLSRWSNHVLHTLLPMDTKTDDPAFAEAVDYIQGMLNDYIDGTGDFSSDLSTSENGSAFNVYATATPVGSKGGQCGRYVNQGTGIGMGDSYESKMAKTDPSIKVGQEGDIFVMKYEDTGHTGFIKTATPKSDGTIDYLVRDSNYGLDEKVREHVINSSKITGFARVPFKSQYLA